MSDALVATGLQKTYGSRRVVNGVSFTVRRGMVLGFLTKEFVLTRDGESRAVAAVYVPTNHLYLGDVLVYPRDQVFYPDVTVEEGLRVFLTGGMALPNRLTSTPYDHTDKHRPS